MNEFQESSAELKARAAKYAAEGEYLKAMEEYKKMLRMRPEDPDIMNLVGDTYRRLGKNREAIEMFEKAARVYASQAYYDNAVAVCKKILRMEPDRSEVLKMLAELYLEQGLSGQATSLLVDYAMKKKEEGNHEAMLNAYRNLTTMRPKDIGLRMKLADEYIGLGRMEDACIQLREISILYREDNNYEEVANIDKLIGEISGPGVGGGGESYWERAKNAEESGAIDESVDYYYRAAAQLLNQNAYHLARDAFVRITELKPEELKSWQKLAQMARALNDKSGVVGAYFGLGQALTQKAAVESAISVYKKILVLEPNNERAREEITSLEKREPTPVEATGAQEQTEEKTVDKPVFKVAEEVLPEQPIALDELISEFNRGVEEHIGEDDYATHYDLGVSFKEMGRIDEAIDHFKKAAGGNRERLKAYELLGRCYIEKQDYANAVDYLKKGLSEEGFNQHEYLGLRYNLGITYEATGKVDEALKEYKAIESRDSQYFDVAERVKKLEGVASDSQRDDERSMKESERDKISYI
jgi:tetratricopeptide (TPR) repeat protein